MHIRDTLGRNITDKLKTSGRAAGKGIAYGLLTTLLAYVPIGCAAPPTRPAVNLKPGMPNTVTYTKNGRKVAVWDLRGCWKENRTVGTIRIEQNEKDVTAYSTDEAILFACVQTIIRKYLKLRSSHRRK